MDKLWTPVAPSASRTPTSPRSPRRDRARARRRRRRLRDAVALVDRPQARHFWREMWDYGGRRSARRATRVLVDARPHAGRALVPRRDSSTSRRTCSSAGRPTTPATRSCSGARTRCARRMSHAELHALASRVRAGADGARASPPATASRRTCRTCPRRSSRCSARRARRDLVVVLAGLRRAGRARPLRPDRAAGARSPSTATGTTARRSRSLDKVATIVARLPTVERVVVVPYLRADRHASQDLSAVRDAVAWDAWLAPLRRRPDRLRAAAVRSSALHPVLVGHDGRAEVHRARRRRHAAAAPEGAPAARRREAAATACSTSRPAAG